MIKTVVDGGACGGSDVRVECVMVRDMCLCREREEDSERESGGKVKFLKCP